ARSHRMPGVWRKLPINRSASARRFTDRGGSMPISPARIHRRTRTWPARRLATQTAQPSRPPGDPSLRASAAAVSRNELPPVQDVFGFSQLEQGNADERKAGQIERFDRFFRGQGLQPVFAFLAFQLFQGRDSDFNFQLGMDQLHGFAVFDSEGGSQCLMPLDDFIETIMQSRYIHRATKPKSVRQVIR